MCVCVCVCVFVCVCSFSVCMLCACVFRVCVFVCLCVVFVCVCVFVCEQMSTCAYDPYECMVWYARLCMICLKWNIGGSGWSINIFPQVPSYNECESGKMGEVEYAHFSMRISAHPISMYCMVYVVDTISLLHKHSPLKLPL